MTSPDDERPASRDARARPALDPMTCLRCGSELESAGITEIRTGGSSGATHFFLGAWAELGEGKLAVEILHCRTCRHLELRAPE
ncbi:MAG TPA: hypothetical protein VH440_06040 [Candidatus Limnocylindrales bacterium]|jgi:hypothetical protein